MTFDISTRTRRLGSVKGRTVFRQHLRGRALTVKIHRRGRTDEMLTTYVEIHLTA